MKVSKLHICMTGWYMFTAEEWRRLLRPWWWGKRNGTLFVVIRSKMESEMKVPLVHPITHRGKWKDFSLLFFLLSIFIFICHFATLHRSNGLASDLSPLHLFWWNMKLCSSIEYAWWNTTERQLYTFTTGHRPLMSLSFFFLTYHGFYFLMGKEFRCHRKKNTFFLKLTMTFRLT